MPPVRLIALIFVVIAAAGLTVALATLLSADAGLPVAGLSALALVGTLILLRPRRP